MALYLVVLYGAIVLFTGLRSRLPTARWAGAAILVTAALVLPGGWVLRNYSVFSLPRLTDVDQINLIYFFGAGAYQIERGLELEPAQQAISQEFNLLPYQVVQNSQTTNYPVAKIVADLQHASPRVLLKYPESLIYASCLAIPKAFASHNAAQLAELTGGAWVTPRAGELIRFRRQAFERLAENGSLLTFVFMWQLAHTALSLIFGLLGVVFLVRSSNHRPVGLLCLVSLLYFLLTIPLFGLEAYYRCRFPVLPFLFFFAGCGLGRFAAILKGEPIQLEPHGPSLAGQLSPTS